MPKQVIRLRSANEQSGGHAVTPLRRERGKLTEGRGGEAKTTQAAQKLLSVRLGA